MGRSAVKASSNLIIQEIDEKNAKRNNQIVEGSVFLICKTLNLLKKANPSKPMIIIPKPKNRKESVKISDDPSKINTILNLRIFVILFYSSNYDNF